MPTCAALCTPLTEQPDSRLARCPIGHPVRMHAHRLWGSLEHRSCLVKCIGRDAEPWTIIHEAMYETLQLLRQGCQR